jgi:hypothetical protein
MEGRERKKGGGGCFVFGFICNNSRFRPENGQSRLGETRKR